MALPIPDRSKRPQKKAAPRPPQEEVGLPDLQPSPRREAPAEPAPEALKRSFFSRKKAEEEIPEGYAKDPKTGVLYRALPKTEFDSEGKPLLAVPEFDADDLNGEASSFLAHLRVAPSKEEMKALREARAERARKQQQEWERSLPPEAEN